MPASSAMPRRRPPITASRSGTIRRTANCSTAPSCRCWSAAISTKRCKYAERIVQADKNDRVAQLVLGVHALKHKQYADRAPRSGAVGPRADHRSDRDAAVGLVAGRAAGDSKGAVAAIDRLSRAGLVRDLQGSACRHDLRPRRQQEGSGQTLRARLQARSHRAARGARPMAAGCRATPPPRRRSPFSRPSTRRCRAIRWWSRR